MTSKRMFNLCIVDSDAFLDMPTSSQLLYFQLGMRADDDGFVGNPKKIARVCNCTIDDLKVLISKDFIIPFKDGAVAIKHWRMNNNKPDMAHYRPTKYQEDLSCLYLKTNKAYTIDPNKGIAITDNPMLFENTEELLVKKH